MVEKEEPVAISKPRDKDGYLIKTCSQCGKCLGKQWLPHWKIQHPDMEPKELEAG